MQDTNKSKKDANQVVEVQFPGGGKTYSYVGSGNLRVGQEVKNAPVTHYISGKNYTAPVKIVATHNVVGAEVGDKIGVSNGSVKTIPTGLKYLPGTREQMRNDDVSINGVSTKVNDYMSQFQQEAYNRISSRAPSVDTSIARARLLGGVNG